MPFYICNNTSSFAGKMEMKEEAENRFQEWAWSACIVSHFNTLFSCPGPANSDAFLLSFSFRFTVQIKARIIICLLALLFFHFHSHSLRVHCTDTAIFAAEKLNQLTRKENVKSVCARAPNSAIPNDNKRLQILFFVSFLLKLSLQNFSQWAL